MFLQLNSPPPSVRKFFGTSKANNGFVRIRVTNSAGFEGKGNPPGNLEARSTANKIWLLPATINSSE